MINGGSSSQATTHTEYERLNEAGFGTGTGAGAGAGALELKPELDEEKFEVRGESEGGDGMKCKRDWWSR